MTLEERFWAKVQKTDGCWLWTAGTRSGYGTLRSGGKRGPMIQAHRLSWELANGPMPQGAHILHSCDNKLCVNPAHLRPGTQADNTQDAIERGRYRNIVAWPGNGVRPAAGPT